MTTNYLCWLCGENPQPEDSVYCPECQKMLDDAIELEKQLEDKRKRKQPELEPLPFADETEVTS